MVGRNGGPGQRDGATAGDSRCCGARLVVTAAEKNGTRPSTALGPGEGVHGGAPVGVVAAVLGICFSGAEAESVPGLLAGVSVAVTV